MTRIWLAATTALTLMTGVAAAQTTTSTTTTETTAPVIVQAPVIVAPPVIAPAPAQSETISQRSVDSNGFVTDRTRTITTGTTVNPYGDATTTRRTTETTTVR